jgi:hypothetical protein
MFLKIRYTNITFTGILRDNPKPTKSVSFR